MIRNQRGILKSKYPGDVMVELSRALRRRSTDAEQRLWRSLRGRQINNLKFRRQAPLGTYILDFYNEDARLAIELDGSQHSVTLQSQRDKERDKYLSDLGVRVLRFNDNEIFDNLSGVLARILEALTKSNISLSPSPSGRGLG